MDGMHAMMVLTVCSLSIYVDRFVSSKGSVFLDNITSCHFK